MFTAKKKKFGMLTAPWVTVLHIKSRYAREAATAATDLRVLFDGEKLSDDSTMADMGAAALAKFDVVVSVRGGGPGSQDPFGGFDNAGMSLEDMIDQEGQAHSYTARGSNGPMPTPPLDVRMGAPVILHQAPCAPAGVPVILRQAPSAPMGVR